MFRLLTGMFLMGRSRRRRKAERRTILNIIHEKGGYKELINLIGKYVKVKGDHCWVSELPNSADFFMCKIEGIKQVEGRDSAYFKVSHYIYVMDGEKIDYETTNLQGVRSLNLENNIVIFKTDDNQIAVSCG